MQNKAIFLGPIMALAVLAWSENRVQDLQNRIQNLEEGIDYSSPDSSTNRSHTKETLAQRKKDALLSKKKQSKKSSYGSSSSKKYTKHKIPVSKSPNDDIPSDSIDLTNPEVQEALDQFLEQREQEQKAVQRAEGVGKYLDYVDDRIESFSTEYALPVSTREALMAEIQQRTHDYVTVEHAAEDGEMDWSEAKPEMARIKEEGKTNLIEILGEEEYQVFEQHVWGKK